MDVAVKNTYTKSWWKLKCFSFPTVEVQLYVEKLQLVKYGGINEINSYAD